MLLKITVEVFPGFECPFPSHEVPVCLQNVPRGLGWEMRVPLPSHEHRGPTRRHLRGFHVLSDASHEGPSRITLKMHWRERTAANFCADACFWTMTKTPEDLFPSCLEVMWKLVYWQLSMRQPGFSKGSLPRRK